jgi:YVTN family beta-propeller protein
MKMHHFNIPSVTSRLIIISGLLTFFACSSAIKKRDEGAILLVANKHSNTLSFVDPFRFKVIETIPVGPNPHEIVVTPDQRYAYLTNYAPPGNTISLIDLVQRKHIMQISTGEYSRIHGCAMASDGKNAYFTAGQSGYIVEIDTRTNQVTRAIPTHGKISHMVYVSPDDKFLYTANIVSENVSVIDRRTGELIRQIPCGKGVEGMAFTPDGKYLWAANQTGGTITIIEVANGIPVETFECPGMPVRIKFTRDGKLAIVAGWVKEGVLTVLDVASRREIKRIRVGDFAIGIELTPDDKHAFVGCEDPVLEESDTGGSNTVNITAENSKGIHVIDMKTLSVVKVIKTGMGPDPMVMWFPPEKWQ